MMGALAEAVIRIHLLWIVLVGTILYTSLSDTPSRSNNFCFH
jgi:hypothetical protein